MRVIKHLPMFIAMYVVNVKVIMLEYVWKVETMCIRYYPWHDLEVISNIFTLVKLTTSKYLQSSSHPTTDKLNRF
jgi:hypothetical protein